MLLVSSACADTAMRPYLKILSEIRDAASSLLATTVREPAAARQILRTLPQMLDGSILARDWNAAPAKSPVAEPDAPNRFRQFFDAHSEGHGLWKWIHYFDIYERHLRKFAGRPVALLEIGIFSGGSLEMWRSCLGPDCHIYGVDIEEACKAYEKPGIDIFIGDQADRAFWRKLKAQVPVVDIIIDDGGHLARQQIVTLEETLPILRPGGVYLCEDIGGVHHGLSAFAHGLSTHLHAMENMAYDPLSTGATPFQESVASIHHYPFVTVIEKTAAPVGRFASQKHGTQWQPFPV